MNSGKYKIEAGQLVNIQTGVPIPDDEPVFILRAKDSYAERVLECYQELCETVVPFNDMVDLCMKKFLDWQAANPDKVKEPD